jgi:mannose-6-phosphate isomerase-like protein (cupin superfamily)
MATGNSGASRSFSRPDDHLTKGGVEIDVVQLGDLKAKRATYPPGWRFSERMGAPRCYDTHVGYTVSGRIVAELDDGTSLEFGAGDVFMVPAGHDAYVIGDEPCVLVQFDEGESAAGRFNLPGLARAA